MTIHHKSRPKIMGIVNVTPDSFSDGGQFKSEAAAARHGLALLKAGADILDIGGESTRPGAQEVPVNTELKRVIGVIERLRKAIDKDDSITAQISIDTRKPEIAKAAIKAGADIWNDVSALTFSDDSVDAAAKLGCPVILMHALGPPETMQSDPSYGDVIAEIKLYLATRMAVAVSAGVKRENIILDPGIGFGKRLEDNLTILRHLKSFKELGCRLLIGGSRKSFISKIDGSEADSRLGGSLATALWSASRGADIIRVHDVAETVQALTIWQAIDNETAHF